MSLEGGDRLTAECNAALGAVHSARADWDEAEACFEQAIAVHRRVGHLVGATDSLSGLGLMHERRGNWQRARELYQEAVEITAGMDPCVRTVLAGRHLGRLLLRLGDREAATDILGRTLDLAEQIPLSIEYAPTLLAVAELRRPHDLADALRLAERALQAPRTAETAIEIGASLASWYVDAGRLDDAVQQVAVTLAAAERLHAPLARGVANLAAGRLAAAQGDDVRAEQVLRVALGYLTVAQTPYERSAALCELAAVMERASGNASQSTVMRREAATLLDQIGVQRPGPAHVIGCTPSA
jgi:tetratricopeptide (TPR) repeat protein